ncbi:uncharacterized protein [Spinacia oleracea]|uniref:Reverse transcriptase zinc-binding domain-containing protein n=1 Tax=Spinacia oleracea TaxID=3562 RepID=A0A9R0HW43_SPIOL|nr:uncharacterized protein LOC110777582 [Spinacia oleracea]
MQAGAFDQFIYAGKFKISKMYKYLHDIGGHVAWKRIICNSKATPKASFIVWLALQKRLPTKDMLRSWGMSISSSCELCQAADESLDHMFFDCSVSKEVWSCVLLQLGVSRSVMQWELEVQWCSVKSRSTKEADIKRSIAFSETVYALWLQRNAKLFKNKLDSVDCIIRRVLFIVACRKARREAEEKEAENKRKEADKKEEGHKDETMRKEAEKKKGEYEGEYRRIRAQKKQRV